MRNEDFLKQAAVIEKENETFSDQLQSLAKKVQKMETGKQLLWEDTDEFKKIIEFIGKYPPLKLIEDVLSYYTNTKHELIMKEIPGLMQEAGITKCDLKNGTKIKLEKIYSPSIINNDKFFAWLDERGYSAHIKSNLEFIKSEMDNKLQEFLLSEGYSYKEKEGVHAQTLKRIVRERVEAGEDLPDGKTLSVTILERAKVS